MLLDRIRRVTRDGRWIPEIDGLRFIAIISVVLFHIAGEVRLRSGQQLIIQDRYLPLDSILNNGDRGVQLFFVISGMILAMPFARHYLAGGRAVSLKKFYIRRVTRLEPPYLVSIVIFCTMATVYSHGHPGEHFFVHAAASAVYLHSLIYHAMSPVNMVTYTLEIEIQFYLLAPLFMQLLRIPGKLFRRLTLVALIVALALASIYLPTEHASLFLPNSLHYFLTGLLVADIFVLDLDAMQTSRLWDVVAVVALYLLFGIPRSTSFFALILPLALVLLFISALRSKSFRWLLSRPLVAVTGGMCYSIYLLHFALIAAIFKASRHLLLPRLDYLGNLLIQIFLQGCVIAVFSLAFYLLVERPCMDPNWPGQLWHKLTGHKKAEVAVLNTAE